MLLFAFSALFLTACQNNEPAKGNDAGAAVSNVEIIRSTASGPAHTSATLHIEGMMCAKACGGKIMQELAELKGVSDADIDYADGREFNTATVTFDPSIIDESAIIASVNTIADGKLYKVIKLEVVTYTPSSAEETETEQGAHNAASVLDLQSVFRFPNVFQMIRNFLVG